MRLTSATILLSGMPIAFVLLLACSAPAEDPGVQLMNDLRHSVENGTEFTNREELGRRLELPQERLQAINVGPGSKARLADLLSSASLGYICTEASCTCTGDADCNDMYSTVCNDPKTNGACIETSGRVTCSCQF